MNIRKSWTVLLSILLLLSACAPVTPLISATSTPPSSATEDTSAMVTPTMAASSFNVPKEALNGVRVNVWHPWFGAEASLFQSQIEKFNKENEWGIIVSAQGKGNYNELYLQTDAALKDANHPQIVIAFPEHALGWQDHVIDLNPYVHDSIYGMNALEISDFANVAWLQDEVDGKRFGVPAQ